MTSLTDRFTTMESVGSVGFDVEAAQTNASQLQRVAWRSAAFEHLSAAGAVLDEAGRIVATNAAWRLFATLNDALDGTTGEDVNYLDVCARAEAGGDEDARQVLAGLRQVLGDERTSFDHEYPCPSPDQDRWFLLHATSAPVVHGSGIVLFHVDITARKLLEESLAHRANHDHLTGLGNRGAARAVLQSTVESTTAAAHVISFDLDGFKPVNDTYGHHVGDEVLVQVANRARRVFGEGGRVFRLGGDEFLAVCAGATREDAERFSAALRTQMSRPFQVGAVAVAIGASTGVACSSHHDSADDLLAQADAQMYTDKRARSRRSMSLAAPPAAARSVERASPQSKAAVLAESELRALQATANSVLAHATDLVVFFSAAGDIEWASPASKRLLGIDPSVLVGQNGMDLVHPEDRDRVIEDLQGISASGDVARTEFRLEAGDRDLVWLEGIVTNLIEDPDVGAVVGHIRDITERKQAESELLLQAGMLAAAGQAMIAHDNQGLILYWNQAAEGLYGWTSDEALGRKIQDLLPPSEGWEDRAEEVGQLFREGSAWSGELLVTTRSGATVPVMVSGRPVVDASGTQTATIVVSSDISERIAQQEQAERARRRLEEAQASAGLGSFEIDLLSGEVSRSAELWRILGHDPDTADVGLLEAVHPEDRAEVSATLGSIAAGRESVELIHRVVRPDGAVRWVVSQAHRATGGAHRLSGTTLDITERHLAEMTLAHQADHDPLTGLANRRLFVRRLEASLDRNLTTGKRTAVVFIDLDDFKAVNDRIGHVGGDELLSAVGDRIDGVLSPGDTLARFGGDEFVVCVDDVAALDGILEVVERVRAALAAPLVRGGESFTVSASIGVVLSQPDAQAEVLLRNADAAMYAAKQVGSGLEVFDEAMQQAASRRRGEVAELRDAIASGQMHTWFQPEVEVETGQLIGFEALVRWVHPERGVIGPGEFIGLAEESGLIHQLGRQVLVDACRELGRWIDRHPDRHLTVSVNLSPAQMAEPGLVDDVRSAIADAEVPAGRICLEVTESSLMDADRATQVLRSLKGIGVLIAIDDFGTGYSSLSRLKRFPVDYLKIDQSFIAGLGRDPEDELIVGAVASLARSMGIQVIAEGVETRGQLTMLAGMGCEFAQGYLWSRPMPPAEALAYAAHADSLATRLAPVDAADAPDDDVSVGAKRTSVADSVAFLVHELASPLTVSMGSVSILRGLPDDAPRAEREALLDALAQANQDMVAIIEAMGDVRRLEEGSVELARERFDLVDLLSEVIATSSASGPGGDVRLCGHPSAAVVADPSRLRQVFRNLLSNAQKWQSTKSWVEVNADHDRHVVTVSVFDDGPGVPAERVADLFRRFACFDRSRSGHGLGLYIARALARAHDGDIRYHRTAEGGSKFAVELPLAPPAVTR